MDSGFRDCRFSPNRGFDKLSLSGRELDFEGLFPLALSPSKGVFAFIDSPFRRNDEFGAVATLSGDCLQSAEKQAADTRIPGAGGEGRLPPSAPSSAHQSVMWVRVCSVK